MRRLTVLDIANEVKNKNENIILSSRSGKMMFTGPVRELINNHLHHDYWLKTVLSFDEENMFVVLDGGDLLMKPNTLGEVLARLIYLDDRHAWYIHDCNNEVIVYGSITNLFTTLGTRWFDYPINEANRENHYIKLAVQVF